MYALIMKAAIFKGLQARKFPMYQLFGLAQQVDAMKQGNLLMQTDPFGNSYFAPTADPNAPIPVNQPDGSTATVHTPNQESDVDAKIDALRTELKQFTNKAVGQSESRVRDDISKVLAAVNALNPPVKPPKPPKGK